MLHACIGVRRSQMKTRLPFWPCLAALAWLPTAPVFSWGPVGHEWIGNAAVSALEPSTRAKVMEILDVRSPDQLAPAVERACSWPDTVRDNPQWSWSAPLHYVDLPRYSGNYDRQRDCPDGSCATEGILRYAAALGRPSQDREGHRQAFGWLCHLVGDLHQPLHAGFHDDRGGNRIGVEFRGKSYNLHQFWDSGLVSERVDSGGEGMLPPAILNRGAAAEPWEPADLAAWTAESHAIASARAYPPAGVITDEFAEASWEIILDRWRVASARLAQILEAILAEDPATVPP